MSVIWKRLQRVNKRASKYRVNFELHEVMVEGTSQWQPNKLSVVLTRRRRRIVSQPMPWESTILNPYRGLVVWHLPEILDVDVTLYRSMRSTKYEDKEWTLAIEDISSPGARPRRIATRNINISDYVDEQFAVPSNQEFFKLPLNLTSKKVKEVYITLVMSTQFLKEGKATDYDMESVTSMMSVSANDGVQNLDDDEVDIAEHSAETSAQISQIANQFSKLLERKDGEEEEADRRLTDASNSKLERAPPDAESAVKSNGHLEEDSANRDEVPSTNSTNEKPTLPSLSVQTSPSGTFASSAESPSAVINFKAPNSTSSSTASRQSAPDYERVTHSAGGQAHSATKSADHDAAKASSSAASVIAPNSADLGSSVSSHSDELQHRQLLHVARRDNTAHGDADLRSRASDSTGETQSESKSKARRHDNRPKWTGPNLDESAFRGNRFLSSPDRDSEQMPVYSAAEELLSWCQQVTEGYHGVKITNMTTSFRNGLAFCALIHHFRPDLIDFDSLKPNEVVRNCSLAFEAAFSLGIPKIIEAKDMVALTVPDRLSVMTYLYQLKSYFSGQTPLLSKTNSYTLSQYNELEEEGEEEDGGVRRNISEIKSKCLDLFDCLDELDNAGYMHKLQSASGESSSGSIAAPTTSQMTSAYQQKLQSQNWNDYLDNTRNNNQPRSSRPVSRDGHGNNNNDIGEHNGRGVDSRNKLMTRKQLMNPFDSDSDEEIELISKNDAKPNHWSPSTPSTSSTDSEENCSRSKASPFPKEPIRKPLQFANGSQPYYPSDIARMPPLSAPRPLPTSYSTSSFPTYRLSNNSTVSVHSGLSKLTSNEPVEVAPGLLDLSSVKAYRLQRAFSAPTCQSFLVDPRKRPQFREEELRERARQLLESVRKETKKTEISRSSNTSSLSREQDERQRALRERARKLIADARQGIIAGSSLDSPVSMASNSTTNSTNTPVMSPLDGGSSFDTGHDTADAVYHKYLFKSDFDKTKGNAPEVAKPESRPPSANSEIATNNKAKLYEFSFYKFNQTSTNGKVEINGNESNWTAKTSDRGAVKNVATHSKGKVDHFPETFDSMQQEIESIEKQQKQIDSEAAILEKRLRKIMDTGGNKRLEEKLIQNWFVLVNKRNALIRRQMQLNIREKEADMNRRYEELNQELRTLVSIDDSIKTDAQRAREKKLLDDLVQIVDKRDELVRHLDNQEKAIEEDELVESATQGPIRLMEDNEKNCVIQ